MECYIYGYNFGTILYQGVQFGRQKFDLGVRKYKKVENPCPNLKPCNSEKDPRSVGISKLEFVVVCDFG
jgi:hypothetical protein